MQEEICEHFPENEMNRECELLDLRRRIVSEELYRRKLAKDFRCLMKKESHSPAGVCFNGEFFIYI